MRYAQAHTRLDPPLLDVAGRSTAWEVISVIRAPTVTTPRRCPGEMQFNTQPVVRRQRFQRAGARGVGIGNLEQAHQLLGAEADR